MSSAHAFLTDLLGNAALQNALQQIPVLDGASLPVFAAQNGYPISVDDLNATLTQNPDLIARLQALMSAPAEFELNEAEMALIAGGNTGGTQGPSQDSGSDLNKRLR